MKIETVVTERDKRLLYGIGLVLLVVVFALALIMPAMQTRTERLQELSDTDMQVEDVKINIAEIPLLQTREQTLLGQWAASCDDFYPVMSNDAVDALVTGLEMNHGLTPRSLSILEAVQTPLAAFDEPGDTAGSYSPVQTVAVTFGGLGTTDQLLELVDDVNDNYPSIRITGFSIEVESVNMDADGSTTGVNTQYNVSAEIYMCDKT